MSKIILNAKERTPKQKGDFKGWIKGVVYGPELKENKTVWVKLQDFNKAYQEAGKSTLVDLKIENEKDSLAVIFHDMQYDGLTNDLRHIDFYKVKMGEKIDTTIKLEFVGEAPAVKEKGGILVKGFSFLEARCLPKDLVSEIKVDLAELKDFDDSITIEEIKIPAGIEITNNPEMSVVSIARPRSEEELEQLDEKVEMDVDQVEVERGGDKGEEDDEEKGEKPKEEKAEKQEDKK
jgi:large subunit ribosomal protein L25